LRCSRRWLGGRLVLKAAYCLWRELSPSISGPTPLDGSQLLFLRAIYAGRLVVNSIRAAMIGPSVTAAGYQKEIALSMTYRYQ
jgi:hypothetical protein